MNDLKIAFRAPWYERERHDATVNDTPFLRPVIQKYDDTSFVRRLVADPQDSLEFTDDDRWSYPVPVTFPAPGTGRQRFATSRLVRTQAAQALSARRMTASTLSSSNYSVTHRDCRVPASMMI